ncbi:Hydrogen peroxide-inducible genes activator [Pontiella desulfatans]|uniref:Hydrogen peroxide-inducible genes activator n=1 Tax=Pontiella desulfatans TaxID=2750659 RepID=A0A6C2UEG6_PONDE|nr:LysR substrate-binding domain-containing protein [Pontiella desulfatans]VGO17821.1 Hydrogen peroxide-inducible genes activator [Pontiella desulfatans]
MNLQAFKYLLALEAEGGFHRAAEACNVSQPALSIQIKKFEEELDIRLLERGHKGFFFTPAGKEVLERARIVMQQVAEIEELSELWNDPYAGQLSIGAFPTLAPYYLPSIIDHLVDSYPNLQVNLVEEKTHVLLERLKAGTIDAAFLALPEDEPALECGTIFSEEFHVGVAPNHPLAKRKTITPEKLSEEKLLLLEEGHCLRGQALEYCATAGIGEVLNFRASSMETLLQMVSMGRAVSLIPDCVAKRNPHLHYLKLKGGGAERTIALFWRRSSVRRDLMLELVDDLGREYA